MTARTSQSAFVDTPVGRITLIYDPVPLLLRRVLLPGEETGSAEKDLSSSEEVGPAADELADIVIGCLNGERRQPPWDIMRREGIDMWLVICRENNEPPTFFSLVPRPVMYASRTTILIFHDQGQTRVWRACRAAHAASGRSINPS